MDSVDALAQLSFEVHRRLTEIAAEHDLSLTQLRLLGILRDQEPAMLDLAARLHLTKSSVTGLIDRAAARGLVERTAAPQDGRGVHVRLTAEGHHLAKALTKLADASLGDLLAAERDGLLRELSTGSSASGRR